MNELIKTCTILAAPDEVKEFVLRYRIDIPGKPADDIVVQLDKLSALKESRCYYFEKSLTGYSGDNLKYLIRGAGLNH
jgi:hypothetical protein